VLKKERVIGTRKDAFVQLNLSKPFFVKPIQDFADQAFVILRIIVSIK